MGRVLLQDSDTEVVSRACHLAFHLVAIRPNAESLQLHLLDDHSDSVPLEQILGELFRRLGKCEATVLVLKWLHVLCCGPDKPTLRVRKYVVATLLKSNEMVDTLEALFEDGCSLELALPRKIAC